MNTKNCRSLLHRFSFPALVLDRPTLHLNQGYIRTSSDRIDAINPICGRLAPRMHFLNARAFHANQAQAFSIGSALFGNVRKSDGGSAFRQINTEVGRLPAWCKSVPAQTAFSDFLLYSNNFSPCNIPFFDNLIEIPLPIRYGLDRKTRHGNHNKQ
jgi:hypothetical protein